jgi:hypothetical protein
VFRPLEEKHIYYALEYRTGEKFKQPDGDVSGAALVDLVVFDNEEALNPSVLVEFKRAEPQVSFIAKDFVKMMQERSVVQGACFFHLLPKARSQSTGYRNKAHKAIISKYLRAYKSAAYARCFPKWFVLFILDATSHQYYLCEKENICGIDRLDDGIWHVLKARGQS